MKKVLNVILFILILAMFLGVSVLFEVYTIMIETGRDFNKIIEMENWLEKDYRVVISFSILTLIYVTYLLSKKFKWNITEKIYKFRYYIALVALIICLLFNINGSSISFFGRTMVGFNAENFGELYGVSRPIRSDEWMVFTPFALAQGANNFEKENNIIRGDLTDIFIVYGQPVKDISMIFRFFQIGYLVFGVEKGVSFFWCARFIVLFLATFEFGMLFLKKNKGLSFLLACMITLSPTIQWWFAINGLVEMFVCMEVAIIFFDKIFKEESLLKKSIYLAIICICAGTYLLTFYPAWMVTVAYIFLPFILYILITNIKDIKKKGFKLDKKFLVISLIIIMIFLGLLLRIFVESKDTIKIVMNTDYPGKRVDTGKGLLNRYIDFGITMFLPMASSEEIANPCHTAVMLDFWPITLIILLIVLIKERKKDLLLYLLLIPVILLNTYYIFGLPKFLAKITLFSYSIPERVIELSGTALIFILFRCLILMETKISKKIALLISIIINIGIVSLVKMKYFEFFDTFKMISTFVLYTLVGYSIFVNDKKKLIASMLIIVVMSGILINPLKVGLDIIYDIPCAVQAKQVNNEEDGLWLVESENFFEPNLLIIQGLKVINSTNVYPNLERWKLLDEEGKYKSIYNRYAHIHVNIGNYEEVTFSLFRNSTDVVVIELNADALKKLNVKYVLRSISKGDLILDDDSINVIEKATVDKFKIYKLEYK